jgi:threonine/homoserine/homoserine lactone efflux protein
MNCCGHGDNDIFGSGPKKGFFLTGAGTYSGIDYWSAPCRLTPQAVAPLTSHRWQVSIYIVCAELVLSNVQSVVFFIGFTRAFASIRRKMMLNILMQVQVSHLPHDPSL